MKTTTSTTLSKCAELYRLATGSYLFRCCQCNGEFASTSDIIEHVEAHTVAATLLLDEATGPAMTMTDDRTSSSTCSTLLPLQKRCASTVLLDGQDEEDDAVLEPVVKRLSSGELAHISSELDADDDDDDDDLLDQLDDDCDIGDDDHHQHHEDHDNDDIERIRRTSVSPQPYLCQECGKTFSFNYALKNHQCASSMTQQQQQQQQPPMSAVLLHQRLADAGSDELTCDVCGLRSVDRRALAAHMDTHATGEPCVCSLCGASYDTRHDLKEHRRTAHTKAVQAATVAVAKATTTVVVATTEAPSSGAAGDDKPNKCEVCGRKYAKRAALDEHMRVHTGEKPFRCFVCGKAFARRVLVRQHERIHTGETPYKCRHCSMTFTYGASRRAHEKNKHPDVM